MPDKGLQIPPAAVIGAGGAVLGWLVTWGNNMRNSGKRSQKLDDQFEALGLAIADLKEDVAKDYGDLKKSIGDVHHELKIIHSRSQKNKLDIAVLKKGAEK